MLVLCHEVRAQVLAIRRGHPLPLAQRRRDARWALAAQKAKPVPRAVHLDRDNTGALQARMRSAARKAVAAEAMAGAIGGLQQARGDLRI